MVLDSRFSIAPMLDWSDHHCRYFWRLLTRQALLYTEMVTTGALIHGDRERFLHFNAEEHPVALQLGGSDPTDLARCARWAQEWGYDEVNLNCGCPSDRVQSGMFGACLMAQPQLVADCVKAMLDACDLPVTVKHRIGIDDMESYGELTGFIEPIALAGCEVFIVHARKAWLQGLSPKENREIPPLNYPWVYQLKKDFPHLTFVLNGGVKSLAECETHLAHVDGVMIGREAYQNPWMLAEVDPVLFGMDKPAKSRDDVIAGLLPYVEQQLAQGAHLNHITRHILGLYQSVPGARKFRRHLSEHAYKKQAGLEVLTEAHRLVREAQEAAIRIRPTASGRPQSSSTQTDRNPTMTSKLDQLKTMTDVVADTGDIEAIRRFHPLDATTNPSLLLKAAALPHYAELLDQASTWASSQGGSDAEQLANCCDRFAVDVGREILGIIPGRISTEVDARLSFNTEGTIARARKLIGMYEEAGIDRERILIKAASTWEGIRAAEQLEKEGINCNLTLLFGFGQAVACADVGVFLISPFVGRILDWHKANTELVIETPQDDPGVQSVSSIYDYYKQHGYNTVVMGASFRNTGEIEALAGCDRLTISPQLLEELASDNGELPRQLSADSASSDIAKHSPDEPGFRYDLNADAMATEKLAEGIRNFVVDQVKLEQLISTR